MAIRKSFIVWLVLLVAAFLAGYVPEYVRASRLQATLDETTRQYDGLYLRDLAGQAYMQAVEKNYGLAARTAARYFDRVRQMQANTRAEQWKRTYGDLLGMRDKVMSQLDRGDPAVLNDLQTLYGKTRAATIP
jgi:hypothetical protein